MKIQFWSLVFLGLFIFEALSVPLKLSSNDEAGNIKIRQKRSPKEQEDIDLQQKVRGYEKLENLKSRVVDELRLKRDDQMKELNDKKATLFEGLKAILEQESRLKRNPTKELITQLFKASNTNDAKANAKDEKPDVEDPRLKRDETNINPLQANEDLQSALAPPLVKRNLLDSISTIFGVNPMLGLAGSLSGGVANFIGSSVASILGAVLDEITNLIPGFNTIFKPIINMIGTGISGVLKLYGGEGSSILDSIGEMFGAKLGAKKGSSLLAKGFQEGSDILDEIVQSKDDVKDPNSRSKSKSKSRFSYKELLGLGPESEDNQMEKIGGKPKSKAKSVKVYSGKPKAAESTYFNNFNDDSHFNLVYENE